MGDKSVFHTEQIVVGGRHAAEGAFAAGKRVVTVSKHHMRLVVNHGNALLRHGRKRRTKARESVSNGDVVLNVPIAIVVGSQLIRVFPTKHVSHKARDNAAGLFLVNVPLLKRAVDLGVAGWVGSSLRRQIVPVLRDLAVGIEAEDVKGHLLTGPGKVVHGLQEHLVAVLEGADVLNSGFHRRGSQPSNAADKSIPACAVGEVVLDITFCQQGGGFFSVSGCEGVDEGESLFDVCHGGFLLIN